ncbi:MAG: aspartyl/glutamyl-tRNA amidotransferase subunit C [Gemmatimonadetes bacterium]|nr:aspartyl/glutamyl-tRNA amidotransferase subunit C [Gemmatimonadota bacterium]
MAVSKDDVRHIAGLARVGVPEERLDGLVAELNGILGHMDALERVPSRGLAEIADATRAGMPLGADERTSVPLVRARDEFAPLMRDGFFLVPRLATHDDAGDAS